MAVLVGIGSFLPEEQRQAAEAKALAQGASAANALVPLLSFV